MRNLSEVKKVELSGHKSDIKHAKFMIEDGRGDPEYWARIIARSERFIKLLERDPFPVGEYALELLEGN